MTTNDAVIKQVQAAAPSLRLCVGWDGNTDPLSIAHRAIDLGVYKAQLFKPYFTKETVELLHAHGIRANVFFADDPTEAQQYLQMGIDTVLTNDYLTVYNAVKELL
jgi:glycerophosphoryl diester phosphodiesterase